MTPALATIIVGKTIARVTDDWEYASLVLHFTDGTALKVRVAGPEWEPSLEAEVLPAPLTPVAQEALEELVHTAAPASDPDFWPDAEIMVMEEGKPPWLAPKSKDDGS